MKERNFVPICVWLRSDVSNEAAMHSLRTVRLPEAIMLAAILYWGLPAILKSSIFISSWLVNLLPAIPVGNRLDAMKFVAVITAMLAILSTGIVARAISDTGLQTIRRAKGGVREDS